MLFPFPLQIPEPPRLRLMPGISQESLCNLEASRDGTRLVTNSMLLGAYRSRAPRLWDARRMKVLAVLAVPSEDKFPIDDTTFSADGKSILTRSKLGLKVWDAQTARLLKDEKAPTGVEMQCAAISPDGKHVVAGLTNGRLLQWTVGSAAAPQALQLEKRGLTSVRYSGGGGLVAGLDSDFLNEEGNHRVRLWRTEGLAPLADLALPKQRVRSVAFGPSDETAVVTDEEATAHVFEIESGKQLFEGAHTTAHDAFRPGLVEAQYMDEDQAGARFVGTRVLLADPEGPLRLVDARSGTETGRLVGAKGLVHSLRASLDGGFVAAVGSDDVLKVWNVATKALVSLARPKDERPATLEFGPDSKSLWVGSSRGTLRLYDLADGRVLRSAPNATKALDGVRFFKDGGFALDQVLQVDAKTRLRTHAQYRIDDASGISGKLPTSATAPLYSPDGRRGVVIDPMGKPGGALMDATTTLLKSDEFSYFPNLTDAVWEPRGAWVLGLFKNGEYRMYDGATLKPFVSNAFPDQKGPFRGSDVSPDGKLVATAGFLLPKGDPKHPKAEYTVLWNPVTGKILDLYTITEDPKALVRFSPDGKKLGVKDGNVIRVFDAKTTKGLNEVTLIDTTSISDRPQAADILDFRFSPDGSRLWAHSTFGALYTVDFAANKVQTVKGTMSMRRQDDWTVARDGRTGLNFHQGRVDVWDLVANRIVGRMDLADDVTSAAFTPDEKRVATTDPVDGMVVWNFADRAAPRRLGSFQITSTGDTLTMDTEGRYDSSDATNVQGASYVFAWSGGLEPVEMGQMKSRFYEPGLLAKLMGTDPTPRRAVPDVAALQLYPSIRLTPKEDGKVGIEVADRDDGGTGTVEVYVNGKVVATRKGSGYFTWDREAYRSFLIPPSRLRPGERNELRVVAGNETNDLKSPPAVAEIPLPDDLKVPPTRLLALCVGVGDYVGDKGDLVSPPSDATAIADALGKVSSRLLPGAVEVTTLTTASNDPAMRPSRKRILQWFEETAKRAAAGDIVMVFMAGHGTDRIGEASDYFFLTGDCDPADVGPAALGVATISGADLRAALAKIPASKQVVVLDTCHSGAVAKSLIVSRSLSGDYGRAYESLRDASGTWVLAGSASDQLSYESSSVDHGMLTYALLEAIDRASPEGLRKAESGDLFVDVESWLKYAVGRVESLKSELDLPGVQQPELRTSTAGGSFDIGTTSPAHRGELGLRAPRPVVIVGGFSNANDEDPLRLEKAVGASLTDSRRVKPWFDVASHPGAFRVAGSYTVANGVVALRLLVQKFDAAGDRKTIATVPLKGTKADLAAKVRAAVEEALAPKGK